MPETATTATTEPRMQCRHIFTDGHRCAAACLRREAFCYYHHITRRPVSNPAARRRRSNIFALPNLEDRSAIQLALNEILQRIAANELDPERAGRLLYGIQIASTLLPNPNSSPTKSRTKDTYPPSGTACTKSSSASAPYSTTAPATTTPRSSTYPTSRPPLPRVAVPS